MRVTKFGNSCFKLLRYLMLVIMVYWLGSSLYWFTVIGQRYDAYLTIFAGLALTAGLVWTYRKQPEPFRKLYRWLMRHKLGLSLAALVFQVILLLSATMMIRSDAAVVFTGAIKELEAHRIASYLTRNPNNMLLFLYERAFFKVFGSQTVWVLQGINILYTHAAGWLLYKGARRFFSQSLADRVFLLYLLLITLTPKFMAMYTDILALPLLAGQFYLVLDGLEGWSERKLSVWKTLLLGGLTGLAIQFRPTAAVALIAFFGVVLFQKNWRKLLLTLGLLSLSFAAVSLPISLYSRSQQEVTLVKGEGLAKNLLTFVNLGLTFSGTDQEDMQAGLAAYLPPEQREVYDNGRFANANQIAEIKRRLKAYTPLTFAAHILYKQALTTGQGNLNWIYKDASREKTSYMSPLAEQAAKQPLAGFIRSAFIYVDQPGYQYYDSFIQLVWIGLSIGLCLFFMYDQDSSQQRFLALAVFGGLLFLQIFEGGKSRYLIQFLPQILFLASLGWESFAGRTGKKRRELLKKTGLTRTED